MKAEKLIKNLCKEVENEEDLPWLSGYTDFGSFRPEGTPEGSIRTEQIGPWTLVMITISHSGTTMDRTTDRSGGDPYSVTVRYDWVGPAENAPEEVSKQKELDDWSVLNTRYVCEYTDVGSWGQHKGTWIRDLKEDGTVTLGVASGSFQDVSPESTAETETQKLELP